MSRFFHRLQWKLTLSYAVVTAGTVILLAVMMILALVYFETQNSTRTFDSFYWSKTAFQDNIPYLVDDPEELQQWVERVQQTGFNWNDFQSSTVRETLDYANTLVTGGAPVFVLDPDLDLIAAAPLDNPGLIGEPFNPRSALGLSAEFIIDAALVGDKNYSAQSSMLADGKRLVAFPLQEGGDGPLSAIVIYQVEPIGFATPSNLYLYQTFFIVILVVMFIVALPTGAVFGWLATRGLRKRLVTLSTASKSWSRGDFSDSPRDRSRDEVGELTRNLTGMTAQLRMLLDANEELVRMEERNRLARELHDTVKQQTYAARMQLTAAKNLLATMPVEATSHIDAALELNRETQQELSLIIDELRPAALQGKGLAQALKEYAVQWEDHTGIRVKTMIGGERGLPLEVEQAFYRVLQEALSNIARHAEADQVVLTLEVSPEEAVLMIADNGCGFDQRTIAPNSLGLDSMKQRLNEIGGTLDIDSTISAETIVMARVKLQSNGVGQKLRTTVNGVYAN